MLLVFAIGMWAIIGFGSALLTARGDLAGEWELSPEQAFSGEGQTMRLEQSGRFVKLTFAKGPTLNLKLLEETDLPPARKRLKYGGDGATVTFQGLQGGDLWRLEASGRA